MLSLKRSSWNCWDTNVMRMLLCIRSFFAFLIFICFPSFRNLVAMSLGFFHSWPDSISSYYTSFTCFLQSNAFASLLPVTLTDLWCDDLSLLCCLQGSSYQCFLFWYFRSHPLHLIGSGYFHGAAFLTGISFGTKFRNVRECPWSQIKFSGVKRNRGRQNEGLFLHTLTISVTSLFSPWLFSDATFRSPSKFNLFLTLCWKRSHKSLTSCLKAYCTNVWIFFLYFIFLCIMWMVPDAQQVLKHSQEGRINWKSRIFAQYFQVLWTGELVTLQQVGEFPQSVLLVILG